VRAVFLLATASLVWSLSTGSQDKRKEPIVSDDPLTADQIAVYAVVLKNYDNGSGKPLNLARTSEPFGESEQKGCVDWAPEATKATAPVVHKLDSLAAENRTLVLVDSGRQQEQIEKNDPQKLIKSVIDGGAKVSKKQLSDSLEKAFASGLFTFSEIIFNKGHRYALLSYSFVCGSLCGHGETLLLRKSRKTWKIAKHCGVWVS
jgi:hypothetical protein